MTNDKYQMTNTRMPEIMCQVRIEPCHLPFAIASVCHLPSGVWNPIQPPARSDRHETTNPTGPSLQRYLPCK